MIKLQINLYLKKVFNLQKLTKLRKNDQVSRQTHATPTVRVASLTD